MYSEGSSQASVLRSIRVGRILLVSWVWMVIVQEHHRSTNRNTNLSGHLNTCLDWISPHLNSYTPRLRSTNHSGHLNTCLDWISPHLNYTPRLN
jgi:hypothetical protein